MTVFKYRLADEPRASMGLIVLQTDVRIEQDFRRLLPDDVGFFVSRVPSGSDVTPGTLQEMEQHIPRAAELLPAGPTYDAIGYGCTSGTAQIGQDKVAELIRGVVPKSAVTEPLSALLAACGALRLKRLAFLSPYIEDVSLRLRDTLRDQGVDTPVFGSFDEAEEVKVARISPESIREAAGDLARQGGVDGIFLSCTNLDTLDVIAPLEAETGLPVLSSNQVLFWHMCQLAQTVPPHTGNLGRLFI